MMPMIDREAAALAHEITEAAKLAFKDDPNMSYVTHLEIQARAIITWDSDFTWSTECRHGAWRMIVDVAGRGHEEPSFIG